MAHHEYVAPPKPRSRTMKVLAAIGRTLATVIQVIGGVLRGASGGGYAPMTPPPQLPPDRPRDYRP